MKDENLKNFEIEILGKIGLIINLQFFIFFTHFFTIKSAVINIII